MAGYTKVAAAWMWGTAGEKTETDESCNGVNESPEMAMGSGVHPITHDG